MKIYIEEFKELINSNTYSIKTLFEQNDTETINEEIRTVLSAEYLKTYRLQNACQLLAGTPEPVTFIGQACGLGSSSYFGKVFREFTGYTPLEYRRKWQDCDINWQS